MHFDVTGVELLGIEVSLFVTNKHVFILSMVVADPAFKQVKLFTEICAFAVYKLGNVFQSDEHVFAHYDLFFQGYLVLVEVFECVECGFGTQLYNYRFFYAYDFKLGYQSGITLTVLTF